MTHPSIFIDVIDMYAELNDHNAVVQEVDAYQKHYNMFYDIYSVDERVDIENALEYGVVLARKVLENKYGKVLV